MAHYIVGLMKVTDPGGMEEYVSRVQPTIAQYGGRIVYEGEVVEVLEGDSDATVSAVLEFDDAAAARRFWSSPEYTALLELRADMGPAEHVLVRGL